LIKTLQIFETIHLEDLPRMADFALWGEAIARAMGYKPLEFINVYYENIGKQNIEAIEANPLGQAIVKLCEELEVGKNDANEGYEEWYGSTSECLKILNAIATKYKINTNSKSWPSAANWLTRSLNKIRSNLLEGLKTEIVVRRLTKDEGEYKKNTTIRIREIPSLPSLHSLNQY